VAVVRSPVSRNRSLARAVNRAVVASRNPANSSKSPDAKAAKADNRVSVKYYGSVRSLSPGSAGGFFTGLQYRRSNCLTNATAAARISSVVKAFACRAANRCKRSSIEVAFRSVKAHGHPFSVTVDALIGARFPPTLNWYRHNDSHFLRALWTKQHPGGSRGCLARHMIMIMHRHDEFLPVGKTSPMIRLGRRPSRVCIKLLTQPDQTGWNSASSTMLM